MYLIKFSAKLRVWVALALALALVALGVACCVLHWDWALALVALATWEESAGAVLGKAGLGAGNWATTWELLKACMQNCSFLLAQMYFSDIVYFSKDTFPRFRNLCWQSSAWELASMQNFFFKPLPAIYSTLKGWCAFR